MRIYLSIPFGSYLYLLHFLKSVIICLSDTYINMCQLCNAMFHPLGQVFFKVKVLIFLLSYRYWQILRFYII